jgi:hypothetical protein
MHEEWTDKLSEYLDDELPAHERAAVERHLACCESCTGVLKDLNAVVARAQGLESRVPDLDLWPGIARSLHRRGRAAWDQRLREWWASRVTFSMPQAVAAGMAIAALSAAAVWPVALRWSNRSSTMRGGVTEIATARPAAPDGHASADQPATGAANGLAASAASAATVTPAAAVSFADAQYDAAVADLERALNRGRGHLDRTTVVIVEHNLQIIDQAIEQARLALETDPANEYLSSHLVEARRRKLDLLRRAAALADTN